MDEVFEEYIISSYYQITTIQLYKSYYNKYIKPYIGALNIDIIDYDIIKSIISDITCQRVGPILKGIFNFAYNNGYINRMPFSTLKINKKTNVITNKIITNEMYNDLIQYTKKASIKYQRYNSYLLVFEIAWYTGMRIGEILALTKNDIDLINDTITINKTIFYNTESKMAKIKKPKTATSKAIIPLPHFLMLV